MKISFFLKVSMMLVALFGVLFAIKSLKSPNLVKEANDPQSVLGVLLGGDYRPLNWCPAGLTKLEIFDNSGQLVKTLDKASEFSSLCEIMTAGFSSESINEASYQKRILAYTSSQGEIVSLEQSNDQPVFRIKGMPFGSPMLQKVLSRLTNH